MFHSEKLPLNCLATTQVGDVDMGRPRHIFNFFNWFWSVGPILFSLGCWVPSVLLSLSGSDTLHYRAQIKKLWAHGFRMLYGEHRALSHAWFLVSLPSKVSMMLNSLQGLSFLIQSHQTNEKSHLKPPLKPVNLSYLVTWRNILKLRHWHPLSLWLVCGVTGACVFVYVHACICMCWCSWKPEVDIWYLPQLLDTLFCFYFIPSLNLEFPELTKLGSQQVFRDLPLCVLRPGNTAIN